jgi:hypothetical protein
MSELNITEHFVDPDTAPEFAHVHDIVNLGHLSKYEIASKLMNIAISEKIDLTRHMYRAAMSAVLEYKNIQLLTQHDVVVEEERVRRLQNQNRPATPIPIDCGLATGVATVAVKHEEGEGPPFTTQHIQ